jgi:hypothetical protein
MRKERSQSLLQGKFYFSGQNEGNLIGSVTDFDFVDDNWSIAAKEESGH